MIKKRILLVFFLMVFGCQSMLYAQVSPDDIALNDDALEGDFYEALKQRAIENYDKAIIAIDKTRFLKVFMVKVYFWMVLSFLFLFRLKL